MNCLKEEHQYQSNWFLRIDKHLKRIQIYLFCHYFSFSKTNSIENLASFQNEYPLKRLFVDDAADDEPKPKKFLLKDGKKRKKMSLKNMSKVTNVKNGNIKKKLKKDLGKGKMKSERKEKILSKVKSIYLDIFWIYWYHRRQMDDTQDLDSRTVEIDVKNFFISFLENQIQFQHAKAFLANAITNDVYGNGAVFQFR